VHLRRPDSMYPSVVTATHTNSLLWAGQKYGLPPTPDNSHLGCSYHLYSSHCLLSTWSAVYARKERRKKQVHSLALALALTLSPNHLAKKLLWTTSLLYRRAPH